MTSRVLEPGGPALSGEKWLGELAPPADWRQTHGVTPGSTGKGQRAQSPKTPRREFSRSGDGVVIVATGQKYREEAEVLIQSLTSVSPDLPVTVFSDSSTPVSDAPHVTTVVLPSPTFTTADKIAALALRPYRHTLLLDSDTVVLEDISGMFSVLQGCDVAAVHDTWREARPGSPPLVFPEPNTGVLLIDDTPAADRFLELWEKNYVSGKETWTGPSHYSDQPACWSALWDLQCSGHLRFLALPAEFNVTIWHPVSFAQGAKPVIVHGRGRPLGIVGSSLRATADARVWVPDVRRKGRRFTSSNVIIGNPTDRKSLGVALFVRALLHTVAKVVSWRKGIGQS
jgi:hypothetical protein